MKGQQTTCAYELGRPCDFKPASGHWNIHCPPLAALSSAGFLGVSVTALSGGSGRLRFSPGLGTCTVPRVHSWAREVPGTLQAPSSSSWESPWSQNVSPLRQENTGTRAQIHKPSAISCTRNLCSPAPSRPPDGWVCNTCSAGGPVSLRKLALSTSFLSLLRSWGKWSSRLGGEPVEFSPEATFSETPTAGAKCSSTFPILRHYSHSGLDGPFPDFDLQICGGTRGVRPSLWYIQELEPH